MDAPIFTVDIDGNILCILSVDIQLVIYDGHDEVIPKPIVSKFVAHEFTVHTPKDYLREWKTIIFI